MTEKNLLSDPPEKVLLMYRAVADMIGEGADINTMKVSEITARAGIGKGTAYEYFSSKEEIITRALTYDVERKRECISAIVGGGGHFETKVKKIFNYIEEQFGELQTFCMLVRIGTGSYEISEPLKAEYDRIQIDITGCRMEEMVDQLMEQGVADGVITEDDRYLRRMAFSAQLVAFAACLVTKEQGKEVPVTVGQAKDFAYTSLVKSLN